jgi:hypothetical protein
MSLNRRVRVGARSRRGLALFAAAAGMALAVIPVIATPAVANVPTNRLTGYQIVYGATTTINAGQTVGAGVWCPRGKTVTSGGVISHSPMTFINSSFPLSTSAWHVTVTDTGNETFPEQFTPYAVCVNTSSVPGYHQVQSAPLPVGPNTYYGPNIAAADAYCNSGEVAIGGGVRTDNASTFLTVSRPTTDTQAWEVYVHLTNPPQSGVAYYQVFSVCIPSADVSSYTIANATYGQFGTFLDITQPGATATTVPPGVFNTAGSGFCADGQLAVAGGATNHDQTNGFISSVSPATGGKYWVVTDTNINPPTTYSEWFLPNAVCVSATA